MADQPPSGGAPAAAGAPQAAAPAGSVVAARVRDFLQRAADAPAPGCLEAPAASEGTGDLVVEVTLAVADLVEAPAPGPAAGGGPASGGASALAGGAEGPGGVPLPTAQAAPPPQAALTQLALALFDGGEAAAADYEATESSSAGSAAAPAPTPGGGGGGSDSGSASGGGSPGPGDEAGGGGGGVAMHRSRHPGSLRVLAAGCNAYGKCGVQPRTQEEIIMTPVPASGLQPPDGAEIVKISFGEHFVIVLTAQGVVLHAGTNRDGQRGTGQKDADPHPELRPVPLPCPAVDIACGSDHAAAALENGAAATWGGCNQRGLGRAGEQSTPGLAEGVAEAERVYAGGEYTFFLSRGGEVAACGNNDWGQLCLLPLPEGHPWAPRVVARPQRVARLCGRRILQLQGARRHCIMLEADGSVWVWGAISMGWELDRLADGSGPWSAEQGSVPIRVALGPGLCVAAADNVCAVVTAAQRALSWGWMNLAPQQHSLQFPGDQPVEAVVCISGSVWVRSAGGEWAGARDTNERWLAFDVAEYQEELLPINEAGLSALCMPLSGSHSDFALYLEGSTASTVFYRSIGFQSVPGVLNVSGRMLRELHFGTLLSDLGVSAECVVELLSVPRLPPAAGRAGSPRAGLMIFVDASRFGVTDHLCVELRPDATVLDVVAAAAEQLGLSA